MGVDAALYKTVCFGISALYAGIAGGLDAVAVGFVSPESFGLALSLAFLVGIVIGGLASIPGVLFGAVFIEFVPNWADQLTSISARTPRPCRRGLRAHDDRDDGRGAMGIAGLLRSLARARVFRKLERWSGARLLAAPPRLNED